MKTCPSCKQYKQASEFHDAPSRHDGKQPHCIECKTQLNAERMWVNGKHISKKHPLYKPGRYKSLDDAWSHKEIERTTEGEVYIIRNKAWPEWYKVGKAVSSSDRLNGYQTSSPFRDYVLEYYETFDNRHMAESEIHRRLEKHNHCKERKGEWFKTYIPTIQEVMNDYRQEINTGHRDEQQSRYDLDCCNAGC